VLRWKGTSCDTLSLVERGRDALPSRKGGGEVAEVLSVKKERRKRRLYSHGNLSSRGRIVDREGLQGTISSSREEEGEGPLDIQ